MALGFCAILDFWSDLETLKFHSCEGLKKPRQSTWGPEGKIDLFEDLKIYIVYHACRKTRGEFLLTRKGKFRVVMVSAHTLQNMFNRVEFHRED